MSLFSKLLGSKDAGEALDAIKKAAREVASEVKTQVDAAADSIQKQQSAAPAQKPQAYAREAAAAAEDSLYDVMPAEENQYNFSGTYIQYFEKIFREDFPSYSVARTAQEDRFTVYTFNGAAGCALVVELKSERSSAQAIRRRCEAEGVPYLRFYYDHDGWWNTRAYVTERIRRALNG